MSKIVIYQAGLRAGGGKTHAIITSALKRASKNKNTLIVVPTKDLMRETVGAFIERGTARQPVTYHSDPENGVPVIPRVLEHLEAAKADGQVVIITHECFQSLPYFPHKKNWRVFIDEVPQVFKSVVLNIQENHRLITDCMGIADSGPRFSLIECINRTAVKRISENKNQDVVWRELSPISKHLLNDNYRHYVSSSDYQDLLDGRGSKQKLIIYSLLTPNQFQDFDQLTIAAAGIEDTLTYHYWERLGAKWERDEEIYVNALRKTHPYNPTLKIYYGYEVPYSKALRDKLRDAGNNELRDAASKLMNGEKHVWLENNDCLASTSLNGNPNGELLPARSHGLNNYSSFHHVVLFPAFNHTPEASKFLEQVAGFDREMQRRDMNLHLYQAAMRTSIRLDDMTNEKRWVVASKVDAELLSARLPGSTIHSLGLSQPEQPNRGRPRKHANEGDRKRAYEQKRKDDKALRAAFGTNLDSSLLDSVTFLKSDDEKTYKSIGNYVGNFRGSYFDNMYQVMSKSICMNESDFIAYLKDHHSRIYNQKNDIPAICGAMFNPNKTDNGPRDTTNVEFVRGIWIDVEDGDLTPDAFSRAFPSLQFIAYNTFRHTKQKPRFRIYVPTNCAMYTQEAIDIYDGLRYKLREDGYVSGKKSQAKKGHDRLYDGIDIRRNPSMLSLLPCQAQNTKDSFFREFIEGRLPLNVNVWLRQRILGTGDDAFYDLPPIPSNDAVEMSTIQREAVDRAVGAWNLVGRIPENGDASMFRLYRELREACVPMVMLQQVLFDAAANANSPTDRKRQVARLLRRRG